MSNCDAFEPCCRAVERLMVAVAEGKLDQRTEQAINDLLDKAGIDRTPDVECAVVFTKDDRTFVLHDREARAEQPTNPKHLDEKCKGPNKTHVEEVTPMAYAKLSNSGCIYVGGQWICW